MTDEDGIARIEKRPELFGCTVERMSQGYPELLPRHLVGVGLYKAHHVAFTLAAWNDAGHAARPLLHP